MKFLDFEYNVEPSALRKKFAIYNRYLRENRDLFPQTAYEFATADWHYNPQDPKCPHDAWVESLNVSEEHRTDPEEKQKITIQVILLGAYHDGRIKITYEVVKGYNFNLPSGNVEHGDWLTDEIRLSEQNHLIHEIEFSSGGNWLIECRNIKYEWMPL